MDIGKRIKAVRKRHGWSQDELARRCGYGSSDGEKSAKQRISNYENGIRHLSLAEIKVMAKALDVRAEWLAFGTDPGERLTDQERTILHIWRESDPEVQDAIWALFHRLAGEEGAKPPFPASRPALVVIPSTD